MSKLDNLIVQWSKSESEADEKAVLEYMETTEYQEMPYEDRNHLFITSSKLRGYEECPLAMNLKYIDREKVDVEEEDKDYFILGRAVDDYLTHGKEAFDEKYEFVSRRSEGSEKIQMTMSHKYIVENAIKEFYRQKMFPRDITKKNIIWVQDGFPFKVELDYFNLEDLRIGDFKLVADVLNFKPEDYLFQMAVYFYAVLRKYQKKCCADLFVLDKHKGWSRSHMWRYSIPTLEAQQDRIALLTRMYIGSLRTGLWPMVDTSTEKGRKIAFDNPYYTKYEEFRTFTPSIL